MGWANAEQDWKVKMKIGILTFHAQLNYGGVLQCWALQTVLERMGHEVVVLDRISIKGPAMFGGIVPMLHFSGWMGVVLRGVLFSGGFSWFRRCIATRRFIKQTLNLSKYKFHDWKDAPRNLEVDLIVVGSDQVWHCGDWGAIDVYLLEDAPRLPAIAYAASFGLSTLPDYIGLSSCRGQKVEAADFYRIGLSRFKAISCRELEGVRICHDLGYSASHVVDPTLLAWFGHGSMTKKENLLVCYLIGDDIEREWNLLEEFASEHNCKVEIYVGQPMLAVNMTLGGAVLICKRMLRRLSSRVKLCSSADPNDFKKAFERAKWVVSDSFHALMFSIIYDCDIRVLCPCDNQRRQMFARISEFVNHASGNMVVETIKDALELLDSDEKVEFDSEWLERAMEYSRSWLLSAVEKL